MIPANFCNIRESNKPSAVYVSITTLDASKQELTATSVDNTYNLLNSTIEGTFQFLAGRDLYRVTSVATEKDVVIRSCLPVECSRSQMVDVQGISFCVGAALRHPPDKICPAE